MVFFPSKVIVQELFARSSHWADACSYLPRCTSASN